MNLRRHLFKSLAKLSLRKFCFPFINFILNSFHFNDRKSYAGELPNSARRRINQFPLPIVILVLSKNRAIFGSIKFPLILLFFDFLMQKKKLHFFPLQKLLISFIFVNIFSSKLITGLLNPSPPDWPKICCEMLRKIETTRLRERQCKIFNNLEYFWIFRLSFVCKIYNEKL